MIARCEHEYSSCYKDYGGRGISVCAGWHDYSTFRAWALSNGYVDNLEIDRIDNDGNYEPGNCQWVTRSKNISHTRASITLMVNGETACMAEWARRTDIPRTTIGWWIKHHGEIYAQKRIEEKI
jgi:hypothetical protein